MKKIGLLSLLAVLFAFHACAWRNAGEPRGVVREGGAFITNISPVEKNGGLELALESNGKLQYTLFKLESPKRVVIDVPSADVSAFLTPFIISKGVVTKVTAHYFPKSGDSRIEIFLKDSAESTVNRLGENKIVVLINPSNTVARADGGTVGLGPETALGAMDLRDVSGMTRITIPFKGEAPKFELTKRRELNRVTLEIFNSKIKKSDEKMLNVDTEGSIVKSASMYQFSTQPASVKVIANLSEYTSSNVFVKDGNLVLDIGPDAVLASASEVKAEKKREVGTQLSVKKEKLPSDYEGRKVSLDFQGADIHNILRILADVGNINIITSEKVQGKVSMKLTDVPWDMALDIILKNNTLAMVRTGNVIRVATADELSKEKENQATNQATVEKVEQLYLKVFPVNYESSKILKTNLDSMKSARGTIDVNERTNTLIIRDTKEKLAEMEKLISVLDKRTVQVLIEARIVQVTRSSAQQLGIRWGGSFVPPVNQLLPGTVSLSGLTSGTGAGPSTAAGGIVNLAPAGSPTGALGIRFGSLDSTAALDMQLMALENDGSGKILSMPKISTMNNIEALIESGREIPYQTTSSSGTQTQFKNASLTLKVTPHATEDNLIRLDIEANKDEPDFANQLPNSPPPILTKHAKTVVLIKDGDTTVIGGLFMEQSTESRAGVPFFAQIPIIGYLFKSRANANSNEELLIFITPKVL